jgi:hypothetical protein
MQALPNYVKAKTAEGLKTLCSMNSIKKDRYFKYQIIFDGKFWYAFYEEDATDLLQSEIKASEITNVSNEQ